MKGIGLILLLITTLQVAAADPPPDSRDAEIRMLRASLKRQADETSPLREKAKSAAEENADLRKQLNSAQTELAALRLEVSKLRNQLTGTNGSDADGIPEVSTPQLENLGERFVGKTVKMLSCRFKGR